MRGRIGWAGGSCLLLGLLMITGSLLATGSAAPASHVARSTAPGLTKISHIIFIIKENHSFDNYFGRYPGADGATSGRLSTGEIVPLTEASDQVYPDLAHGHQWRLHGRL